MTRITHRNGGMVQAILTGLLVLSVLFSCFSCERPHSVHTQVSTGRWGGGVHTDLARDCHREREEREGGPILTGLICDECVSIYIYIYIYNFIINVSLFLSLSLSLYIYVYIYMHIYIYIYMYTYIVPCNIIHKAISY